MMAKRSRGVTVFGVLFIVFSVLALVSLVATPSLLQNIRGQLPENAQVRIDMTLAELSSRMPLAIALSIGGLIAGIGLLLRQRWARLLAIVLSIGALAMTAYQLATQGGLWTGREWVAVIVGTVPSAVWNGLVIWYFLRPPVKAEFAPGSR